MFQCSICAESSESICVYCTKDACANHLCERCYRCSDCCECEMRVQTENGNANHARSVAETAAAPLAEEAVLAGSAGELPDLLAGDVEPDPGNGTAHENHSG